MFAFGITRSILLRVILRLPLLRSLFRPFVGLFLRSRAGFTFFLPMRYLGLLFRAYFLSFATALTWEFAESIFEEVISTVRLTTLLYKYVLMTRVAYKRGTSQCVTYRNTSIRYHRGG
jgi:hypothetical protein